MFKLFKKEKKNIVTSYDYYYYGMKKEEAKYVNGERVYLAKWDEHGIMYYEEKLVNGNTTIFTRYTTFSDSYKENGEVIN